MRSAELVGHWLHQLNSDGYSLGLAELLYYQQHTQLLNLTPKKAVQAKLAGSYLARSKGRGMEFDEARHYQPGDDIRSIDWRVTARTGKTHTKLYREEKERPVFIVSDLSSSMKFGSQFVTKSVQVAHLSALIAWSAVARGDRIGALLFNDGMHREFRPKMRARSALKIIGALTDFHNTDSTQRTFLLEDACGRLRRMAHPGAKVFVLSDAFQFSETCLQHISYLARHCQVTACVVYDPFDQQLPELYGNSNLQVSDGEQSQHIAIHDVEQRRNYASSFQTQTALLQQKLTACGASYLSISSALPLTEQLSGQHDART